MVLPYIRVTMKIWITLACEDDMINALSAEDKAFIMSSSKSPLFYKSLVRVVFPNFFKLRESVFISRLLTKCVIKQL